MQILFIPGLNCTGELYAPQIAALGHAHECQVADHGVADDMGAIAQAILARAPERFALVGLSMGGYVAYEIMRQAPDRVEKLALLDTRAQADSDEDAERRRQTIALAKSGQFDRLHAIFWQRLVHPARLSDAALEETARRMVRETGPERFIRQQTAVLNRPDYRDGLSAIRVPTMVLVGREDVITPPEHAKALVAAIPGADYVEVPDCGHLSTLERPEAVTAALAAFLTGRSPGAG
jgi:pimeloyl-ACP methyl ester carboxylesterase